MNASQRVKFWLRYKVKPHDKVYILGQWYELISKIDSSRTLVIRNRGGSPSNIDMSFIDPSNLKSDEET